MDVSKISKQIYSESTAKNNKGQQAKVPFEQALTKAMEGSGAGEASKAVSPATPFDPMTSVVPIEVVVDPYEVTDQAGQVLDLLGEYAEALKNPQRKLRDIEPVVTKIEAAIANLESNDIKDHDLAQLINDIAVTASVETFKFRRGDYI